MFVDKVIYDERISVCKKCEHVRILEVPPTIKVLQCNICKCLMTAKAKLEAGKCPAGKFQ